MSNLFGRKIVGVTEEVYSSLEVEILVRNSRNTDTDQLELSLVVQEIFEFKFLLIKINKIY